MKKKLFADLDIIEVLEQNTIEITEEDISDLIQNNFNNLLKFFKSDTKFDKKLILKQLIEKEYFVNINEKEFESFYYEITLNEDSGLLNILNSNIQNFKHLSILLKDSKLLEKQSYEILENILSEGSAFIYNFNNPWFLSLIEGLYEDCNDFYKKRVTKKITNIATTSYSFKYINNLSDLFNNYNFLDINDNNLKFNLICNYIENFYMYGGKEKNQNNFITILKELDILNSDEYLKKTDNKFISYLAKNLCMTSPELAYYLSNKYEKELNNEHMTNKILYYSVSFSKLLLLITKKTFNNLKYHFNPFQGKYNFTKYSLKQEHEIFKNKKNGYFLKKFFSQQIKKFLEEGNVELNKLKSINIKNFSYDDIIKKPNSNNIKNIIKKTHLKNKLLKQDDITNEDKEHLNTKFELFKQLLTISFENYPNAKKEINITKKFVEDNLKILELPAFNSLLKTLNDINQLGIENLSVLSQEEVDKHLSDILKNKRELLQASILDTKEEIDTKLKIIKSLTQH